MQEEKICFVIRLSYSCIFLDLFTRENLNVVLLWITGTLCRYWADIDTQLRRVAYEKRVKVRLLISCWASTQPLMFPFLKSLASVYDFKSKLDIQVVGGFSAFSGRACLFKEEVVYIHSKPDNL